MKMQVVSEHFAGSGFAIFAKILEQEGTEVRAIPAPTGGSRKFCDRMNSWAQKEGLPGMGYIFWREGEDGLEGAGPLAKNIGPERTEAIRQQLHLHKGDAASSWRASRTNSRASRAVRATRSGANWA
jgi:aspartyl-tRNA synthetase